MASMNNNQKDQTNKGRGGKRPNAGRKPGSRVKLSAADILKEIEKTDKPFAKGLAEDYKKARQSGDPQVVQRYQQMILSKVVADKQELDVTSQGKSIVPNFEFTQEETPDWTEIPKTVKTK